MKASRVIVLGLAILASGCGSRSDERATVPHALDSTLTSTSVAFDSSSASAAAEVVREYYAAIEAKNFPGAYRLWENNGQASGKTYESFVLGFADTRHVAVTINRTGRIEGAAGSRYVEIGVTIQARTRAEVVQQFEGTYVLRRSEVDGATTIERRWQLYSARIRATG